MPLFGEKLNSNNLAGIYLYYLGIAKYYLLVNIQHQELGENFATENFCCRRDADVVL